MKKVVIDTGIVVSALIKKEGTSRKALEHAVQNCLPLLSTDILDELNEVLNRPKFKTLFSVEDKTAMVALMLEKGEWIEVTSTLLVCRDKKDDMFLNLAIDGKADAILSRDPDLLELSPFQNIPILNPSDFIYWFDKSS